MRIFSTVVVLGLAAAACSSSGAAESASLADTAEIVAPKCLTDVGACKDIRDTAHPPKAPDGTPIVFDCFLGCGASCNLVDKSVKQISRCQESSGAETRHRLLTYEVTSGVTHEFCKWHDTCYMDCDVKYGEGDPRYSCCTHLCDYGCVQPVGLNESCAAGAFAPKEHSVGGDLAVLRVNQCNAKIPGAKLEDYVEPVCAGGPVPDADKPKWSPLDCALWATTALGADPNAAVSLTSAKPFLEPVAYTQLVGVGAWSAGPCPPGADPIR